MIATLYHSFMFIIALFLMSRLISRQNYLVSLEERTKQKFRVYCCAFIFVCIFTVLTGVLSSEIIKGVLLYFCEYLELIIAITGAELCAVVTDKDAEEKKIIFIVSSSLIYFFIAVLAIRTFTDMAAQKVGVFGPQLVLENNFGMICNIIIYVLVLFIYAAYTYLFYYSMKKKREVYIFRISLMIVAIFAICILVETICRIRFHEYIPVMNFGILLEIYLFKQIIEYRRRIEYDESDYQSILAPSHRIPAFVCNDNGEIIFENIRAFVMKQTYRDDYVGKYITDIFEISKYDRERLKDARITQPFDIYCKYSKEKNEILLKAKHNIDRYGEIFSTEIEYFTLEEETSDLALEKDSSDGIEKRTEVKLSNDELYQLRVEAMVSVIENQQKLYKEDLKQLFILNLKGIIKLAAIMKLSGLEVLCKRIEEATVRDGEWEELKPMLIELDRQYETFKMIR